MATRRRKTNSSSKRRRVSATSVTRRRRNPIHLRRRARRRSNPSALGLVKTAAAVGVGSIIAETICSFLPENFKSGLIGVGVKLGVAFGVGKLAEKAVAQPTADLLAAGGAAMAVKDVIEIVSPGLTSKFMYRPQQLAVAPVAAPAALNGWDGISDIANGGPNIGYYQGWNNLGDVAQQYGY